MKYIVAVSGGVDSIVLLDMLVHGLIVMPGAEYVVAHFDHGIRSASAHDAEFVKSRAAHYGLPFETERVELGPNASEEAARVERYNFLQNCRKKHNASAIITAHHSDDVLETALFNLSRGTGWRGLSSLDSSDDIIRPLLDKTKTDLISHANAHGLTWVEDATNADTRYARNNIRHNVLPQIATQDPESKVKLRRIISTTQALKKDINQEVHGLVATTRISDIEYLVRRYKLIMWPKSVSLEVIRYIVSKLDQTWHPSTEQLKRLLQFCKVAQIGSTFEVTKSVKLLSQKHHIEFKKY